MGLDKQSQRAVEEQIQSSPLLLDTDIVLTYLSEGEPGHDAVRDVLSAWRARCFLSEDVAVECAHHAWIATNEYRAQMEAVEDLEANSEGLGNVFVRGYRRQLERGERVRWADYVRAFRGQSATDWLPIRDIVRDDGWELVTNQGIDAVRAKSFAATIYREKVAGRPMDQRESKRATDKSQRDGRLIACLDKMRRVESERAILVTSSSVLRRACESGKICGDQPAAVPFGAVAYLVALLPGVEVNQKVLKRALFDVGAYSHQRKCEQIVLSVLEASSPFRVHRRRRGFLKREIRRKLFDMAKQRGQAAEDLEDEIRHAYESGQASDAMRLLVTEVAREVVDPTAAQTIEELTARIRQLEAEKAMLKRVVEGDS